MKKNEIIERIASTPAWALSLMIFFATIGLYWLSEYIDLSQPINTDMIAYVTYVILLPASCFIICKTHPKSVWYTPFICNAFFIIMLVILALNYEARILPYLILFIGFIVLSVIGAFVGAKIGRRKINQGK